MESTTAVADRYELEVWGKVDDRIVGMEGFVLLCQYLKLFEDIAVGHPVVVDLRPGDHSP